MSSIESRAPAGARKVALVGFGTVGQAVARILSTTAPENLELGWICTRNAERRRADWVPPSVRWSERIDEVLASDADIVVELIGGIEPAEQWMRDALAAGKSVVTANKQVIARSGQALRALASSRGCHLRFEGAVAGAIPIVRALEDGLAADRVVRIAGVLNGTCNYILSIMEAAPVCFDVALRDAQDRGFAEADPGDDIEGRDAAAKLAILASIAFGSRVAPDQIACRSIAGIGGSDFEYAAETGRAIRQVSWASREDEATIDAGVQPALVPRDGALGRATGGLNVVTIVGALGGTFTFSGAGAGGGPTAVAVVSDLLAIARSNGKPAETPPAPGSPARVSCNAPVRHYVRLPGAVQDIDADDLLDLLARWQIPADRLGPCRSRAVLTAACAPRALAEALDAGDLGTTARPIVVLPILDPDAPIRSTERN